MLCSAKLIIVIKRDKFTRIRFKEATSLRVGYDGVEVFINIDGLSNFKILIEEKICRKGMRLELP